MEVTGKFESASLTLEGGLRITFQITDKEQALKQIEKIKDLPELTITAERPRKKRSLDANSYFWVLCDKIAKRLASDKWTIYLLQLSKYGTVQDAEALGIDTASPEEIEHMISLWKGCKEMNGY